MMKMDFSDIGKPFQPGISREEVELLAEDGRPRVVHFSSYHRNALKRSPGANWVGAFNVPFKETISPIVSEDTGLALWKNKNFEGYWCSIKTEEQYDEIRLWIKRQGSRVFIRDRLALSLALDYNFSPDERRTTLGELERRAKYEEDADARDEICDAMSSALSELPFYREANLIAAVPPRSGKRYDLPSYLASSVAERTSLVNLTPHFQWYGEKETLKELQIDEKWVGLERADLVLNSSLEGESIILIDDLYQSGTTMQYTAMKCLERGAKRIYGLAVVKARSNTDNV